MLGRDNWRCKAQWIASMLPFVELHWRSREWPEYRFVFFLCAHGLQETWAAKYLGSRRQSEWRNTESQKDKKGQEVGWDPHKICARPLTAGQFQLPLTSDLATAQFRNMRSFSFLASCAMASLAAPHLAPHSYAPLGRCLEKVSALWAVPLSLPSPSPDGLSLSQRVESTDCLHCHCI